MGEKQFSLIVAFDLKELNDEIFLIRDAETSDQSGSRGGLLPVGYNREPRWASLYPLDLWKLVVLTSALRIILLIWLSRTH